jgi:tRNA(Ile)-lysidine synthase
MNRAPLNIDPTALPVGSGRLLLACSGGLDSSALLHALAHCDWARQRGLSAMHVDHGLQPASADWARHCAAQCAALEIEFFALRVQVPDAPGGLEQRARDARYAAIAPLMAAGDVLLTAHHQDDQAETFLLRALRGAGERGLGAMRSLRNFGDGWLWRPLLSVPRARIEAYARSHGLQWIDDPSNALLCHDRNYLRHAVLPLLRQRWPRADAHLALSAQRCSEADQRLQPVDALDLAEAQLFDPRSLDLRVLRSLDRGRRIRVLRAWFDQYAYSPPTEPVLLQIERELLHARPDSDAEVRWGRQRLRAWRDALHLQPDLSPWPTELELHWDGRAPLQLPDGHRLELRDGLGDPVTGVALPEPLRVTPRRGGERIHLQPNRPRQCLRTSLQTLGVPPWQRPHLPLLWNRENQLVAVADLLINAELSAALFAQGVCLRWVGPYGLDARLDCAN